MAKVRQDGYVVAAILAGSLSYSFLWLMYSLAELAKIEVTLHGEIAGREVVQQALKHNPDFFRAIYEGKALP